MERRSSETLQDPWLRWSVALGVLLHGALLLSGSYQATYDAWVHIFFGDHYARDWFSTWEPRWYTGFTVTSYPPAAHQSVALLSKLVGLQLGFVIVQLFAIVNVIIGVHRFSLLWVGRRAAGWATVLAVVSSSLAEVVHTFGQLPTTLALGFLLNAQPSIRRWVHDGIRLDLLAAIALLAATTAGHHVTTLFGTVFFTGPVVVRALLDRLSEPVPGEPVGHLLAFKRSLVWPTFARRLRRVLPATLRAAVLAFCTVATLLIVVLPYWLWSSSDPITQVPIPHASRNNFLEDTAAGLVFWLVPWAAILLLAPVALARAAFGRGWPLAASVALLALLGTGGTTPIPRMMLGGAFDILTLDRFTIWATVAILPFVGWAIQSLREGVLERVMTARLGRRAASATILVVVTVAIASSVFAATLTSHRPFQPAAIDPAPIATFMEKDQHDRWRYLTLGFGDQMAWVAANTTALTVDGNYHSARRLPELTSRSVERLEGAKYRGVPGIGSLQQFLVNPSPYHLKFVFKIDDFYDPLLWSAGWQRIGVLDNDVEVWERADIAPLPDELPVRELPVWQRALWGILPMVSLVSGIITMAWMASGRPHPRRLAASAAERPGAGRLLRRIDRRLYAASMRADGVTTVRTRRPWSNTRARVEQLADRVAFASPPSGKRLVAVGLAVVAFAVVAIGFALRPGPADPADTVESFYTALDEQRFAGAHAFLDPLDGPSLDEFLLDVSLRDGLLDGYAELDAVSSAVEVSGDTALATVDLVYLTSVEEFEIRREHDLVRRDGTWYLRPEPFRIEPPVDQLTVRPEVAVATTGRSVATVGRTSLDDLLDRPRVVLGPSHTYRLGERWVVVGTVANVDADPADVTINGVLRDEDGVLIAAYDADESTLHQVLPGETVPYRIEFEGRAGAFDRNDPAAGDFDPEAFAVPVIDREVAVVEVSVRAVVTDGQLERVLDVSHVEVNPSDDADAELALRLRNTGATPATIPRVTVSWLDADGRVMWVDHSWVPDAVRPQRTFEGVFELTLPDPEDLARVVDLDTVTFDNAKDDGEEGQAVSASPTVPVDHLGLEIDGQLVTHLRLDVSSFQREVAP